MDISVIKELYKDVYEDAYSSQMNIRIAYSTSNNILFVEYIGHSDSEYKDGQYFMILKLPNDYPNSPPILRFLTESGRFRINSAISMSITEVHRESWYPMSLYSLITAIISAFQDKHVFGMGHIEEPKEVRLQLAEKSREFNKKHNPEVYNLFEKKGFPSKEQIELCNSYRELRTKTDDNDQEGQKKVAAMKKIVNAELEKYLEILDKQLK